jgi:phosphoglycerate dehydrogenase-like enzyme
MLEGFECEEILCVDPARNWGDDVYEFYQTPVNEFDIISIHASLNETSRGMVNAEFLSKLKPGCIVVNTARDRIVDHKSLWDWLDRDEQAIYAHDFSDEWPGDVPGSISRHPRIIGTPHIGGWTIESLHKTEELLAERVIEWAKSKLEVKCAG